MSRDPIVVTGLGAVCPLGTGAEAVWQAFVAGDGGVRALAPDDERLAAGVDPTAVADVGRAGWVRGFRPREHVKSPHLRRMDWCSRMLVASVRQAFGDAALLPLDDEACTTTALVVGSCYGNQRETAVYLQRVFTSGPAAGQPLLFPNLVLNAAAGYAAIELDVRGPNLCVAQHEASGEAALAAALDLLEGGFCDVVCAAGVDEIGAVQLDALADLRVLHPDALPAARAERARRAGRGVHGGVIPGEGAAALVLERASHARARGVTAYAEVAAARVGSIGAPAHAYAPDARATAIRLLELADVPGPSVDVLLGAANGLPAREALDDALRREIAARSGTEPRVVAWRRLVGDWGAVGALGAVLGSLTLAAAGPSDTTGDARRLLLVGAARGGVLAPVVLDRTTGPQRCSSTASTSSSSSPSS